MYYCLDHNDPFDPFEGKTSSQAEKLNGDVSY